MDEREVGGTLMSHDLRREVRIFASEHLFKWEGAFFGDRYGYEIVVVDFKICYCVTLTKLK